MIQIKSTITLKPQHRFSRDLIFRCSMGWGGSESNKVQYSTVVKYSRVQYKVPVKSNLSTPVPYPLGCHITHSTDVPWHDWMIEWLNAECWLARAGKLSSPSLKTGSFRSEQILAIPQQPLSLCREESQNLQGVLVGTFICLMYCLNYLCKCWSDWNVNGLTAKCCNDSYTWLWNVCNEMTNETKCCSPFDVAS